MKKLLSSMLVLALALGCCTPCFSYDTETASIKKLLQKRTLTLVQISLQGLEFKEIFKKCKDEIIGIAKNIANYKHINEIKDEIIGIAKNIANYKHINEILVGTVMFFLGYKAYPMKLRWNMVWPFSLNPHLKDLVSHIKKIFDYDDIFDMNNFKETIEYIMDDIKNILFGFESIFKDF